MEVWTTPWTILYVSVRRAIALRSSSDYQPILLIMLVVVPCEVIRCDLSRKDPKSGYSIQAAVIPGSYR